MLKNYIGDKSFYKRIFALTIPILVQNGITNFVNMLDNIMVGAVGNTQMTGVSIANMLVFVFNLCIFGCVSGAGIFVAQYFGKGDTKGIRNTFRFKIISSVIIATAGILIFLAFDKSLLNMFLQGEGSAEDIANSLEFGSDYLHIIVISFIPYAIVNSYASTLRETGKPMLPMIAGIVSVSINLFLNYALIFGNFGAPDLGVKGAAISTVIARFCELAVVVIFTHKNKAKNIFIVGAYKSFKVPGKLVKSILTKGLPLMANETLWSLSITIMNKFFSERSYDVVSAAAMNETFFSVFSVAFASVGAAIGIIIGQELGASQFELAKSDVKKLMTFSEAVGIVFAAIYFVCAAYIPELYNTTDSIKSLGTDLMRIGAYSMIFDAFTNASYFVLRSGGQMFITVLFDSGFGWVFHVTSAFLLIRCTSLSIQTVYFIVQSEMIIKDIAGYILVKKGIWLKNITQ